MKWFELLDHTMSKYSIPTGNVFNMDEKGYLQGVSGKLYKVSNLVLLICAGRYMSTHLFYT